MSQSKQVDVIGIPYSFGQPKGGVEHGPKRMREAGIIKQLNGLKVNDLGDLIFEKITEDPAFNNIKRPRAVGKANKQISDAVAKSVEQQHVCLTLGGDHSLAIGSIHGHAQGHPNIGVIWIDAHADINPPLRSPSGNIHGMPLAFLVSELKDIIPEGLPGFEWVKPCMSCKKDLSYIGLRDVDEAEEEVIAEHNVKAYRITDVRKEGIEKIVKMAIEAVMSNDPTGTRQIHLSFDIDALDPTVAPSTGTAVPGGLTMEEGIHIVRTVAATGKLAVMDIVEVNPGLGSLEDQEATLKAANKLVAAWLSPRDRHLAPGHPN